MNNVKYHFCSRCYTTLVLKYDNHNTCPFCGTSFTEGPITPLDTSQLIKQAKNWQRKKNKSRLKDPELATYN